MNTPLLFLNGIGTPELIVIGLLVVLLFGAKKIPELMRGMGKGVREFKDAMKDVKKDIEDSVEDSEEEKEADKKALPKK